MNFAQKTICNHYQLSSQKESWESLIKANYNFIIKWSWNGFPWKMYFWSFGKFGFQLFYHVISIQYTSALCVIHHIIFTLYMPSNIDYILQIYPICHYICTLYIISNLYMSSYVDYTSYMPYICHYIYTIHHIISTWHISSYIHYTLRHVYLIPFTPDSVLLPILHYK